MHEFDELLKACRRRRLKRWVGIVTSVVLLAAALGALQRYFDTHANEVAHGVKPRPAAAPKEHNPPPVARAHEPKPKKLKPQKPKKRVNPTPKPTVPVKKPFARYEPSKAAPKEVKKTVNVRVLQFATTTRRFRSEATRQKRKLQKLGLRCYLKDSADGVHLYLRCVPPENFDAIKPLLRRQKRRYFYVNEARNIKPEPYRVLAPEVTPAARKVKKPDGEKPKSRSTAPEATARTVAKPQPERPQPTPASEPIARPTPKSVKLRVQKVEDLHILESRFERYPAYETALRIAEIFYRRKEYEKAAEWARKANRIDRDKEGAWILFAKAKYAAGEKQKAKRILRIYLDYKSSNAARGLLDEWSRP